MATGGSPGPSTTGPSRCWPTATRASASTAPTTWWSGPTARSGSPTRATASTATTRGTARTARSGLATSTGWTRAAARSASSPTTSSAPTGWRSPWTSDASTSPTPGSSTCGSSTWPTTAPCRAEACSPPAPLAASTGSASTTPGGSGRAPATACTATTRTGPSSGRSGSRRPSPTWCSAAGSATTCSSAPRPRSTRSCFRSPEHPFRSLVRLLCGASLRPGSGERLQGLDSRADVELALPLLPGRDEGEEQLLGRAERRSEVGGGQTAACHRPGCHQRLDPDDHPCALEQPLRLGHRMGRETADILHPFRKLPVVVGGDRHGRDRRGGDVGGDDVAEVEELRSARGAGLGGQPHGKAAEARPVQLVGPLRARSERLGQRQPERVHGDGEQRRLLVAVRHELAAGQIHQGVVHRRVELQLPGLPGPGEGLPGRAAHLGDAAEAQRILQEPRFVALPQAAALEQPAEPLPRPAVTRLRVGLLDGGAPCLRVAPEALQRQRRGDVHGDEQPARLRQDERAATEGEAVVVEERQRLLRRRGGGQGRRLLRPAPVAVEELAATGQGQRQLRQRHDVGGAHRAAEVDRWQAVVAQAGQQPLDQRGPDP